MKRILTFLTSFIMAININALPDWPRKYAVTVVRGHVRNMPQI